MLPWLELSSMLLAPCLDPSMPWPVRSREKRRRRGGLGWEGRSEGLWVLGRREGLKLRREGEEGLRESREGLRDCETRCVRCQSSVAFSHLVGVRVGVRVEARARVRVRVRVRGGRLLPHEDDLAVDIV